jgi:hypothetical protein
VSPDRAGGRAVTWLRYRKALSTMAALIVALGTGWMVPAEVAQAASSTSASGAQSSAAGPVATTSGVQTGNDQVTLLGQSSAVGPGQTFHLRLQVDARDPTHEFLAVQQYSLLADRSYFDEALSGHMTGYAEGPPATYKLTSLTSDPGGGVDIDLPVRTSGSPDGTPELEVANQSGVYPIQIGLYSDDNVLQGQMLTTFLVYAEGTEAETQQPALSVALIVPVHSAPNVSAQGKLQPLSSAASAQLENQIDTLGDYPGVSLSLAATPQTVDALAGGSAVDRSTLAALEQLVQTSHDQVLPSSYVEVPYIGWTNAGLEAEFTQQLAAGASALEKDLGTTLSQATWVVNGPLDDATMGALAAQGAKQLIIPDSELSPLPAAATVTTYAWPTELVVSGGAQLPVYGADVGLTGDFSNSGGAVLAANQLLAELAMIQSETPHYTRGVAVMPPSGWSENSTFLAALLAGLERNPLLRSVTASGLFTQVPFSAVPTTAAREIQRSLVIPKAAPAASSSTPAGASPSPGVSFSDSSSGSSSLGTSSLGSSSGSSGTANFSSPATASSSTTVPASPSALSDQEALSSAGQLASNAAAIRSARSEINGFATVFPTDTQVGGMGQDLLIAESSDVTEAERHSLLGAVSDAIGQKLKLITLPLESSITLTSTKGQIPLTVLASPSLHARVELRLTSERLIFRPFSTAGAACQVPTPTSEVCELTLTAENTTLKVPVETRASGVFPLTVALWSPDGGYHITQNIDTVRSTAVSGVGVILIIFAGLFLGIWWVRDLRHGRRARRLVPAPLDEPADEDAAEAGGSTRSGEVPDATSLDTSEGFDPFVQDFFSTPPPDYEQPRAPRPR